LGTEPDRGGASLATGELAEVPDPLSAPRLARPQGTNPYKAFRFSPSLRGGVGGGVLGSCVLLGTPPAPPAPLPCSPRGYM
jgi:hypothetical protein